MKDIWECLQQLCGVYSIWYQEALDNIFYINDFAAIVAQVHSYTWSSNNALY